jgi:hypothetical protein
MLLSAKPKGVFSWDFEVFAAGRKLVTIDTAWFRQRGRFVLNLTDFDIVRQGWIGSDFALQVGGKVIARAAMGLTRRFTVNIAGRQFLLQAAGPLTRRFRLCENGQTLGTITPMHPLTRACKISLPDDLRPPVQIFLTGLVLLMWQRQQSTFVAASF